MRTNPWERMVGEDRLQREVRFGNKDKVKERGAIATPDSSRMDVGEQGQGTV